MTIDPKNENGKREDVCPSQKGKLDLAAVRAEIENAEAKVSGPEYWRSSKSLPAALLSRKRCIANFPKAHPNGSIPFRAAVFLR